MATVTLPFVTNENNYDFGYGEILDPKYGRIDEIQVVFEPEVKLLFGEDVARFQRQITIQGIFHPAVPLEQFAQHYPQRFKGYTLIDLQFFITTFGWNLRNRMERQVRKWLGENLIKQYEDAGDKILDDGSLRMCTRHRITGETNAKFAIIYPPSRLTHIKDMSTDIQTVFNELTLKEWGALLKGNEWAYDYLPIRLGHALKCKLSPPVDMQAFKVLPTRVQGMRLAQNPALVENLTPQEYHQIRASLILLDYYPDVLVDLIRSYLQVVS
jgi:hypothetical protein